MSTNIDPLNASRYGGRGASVFRGPTAPSDRTSQLIQLGFIKTLFGLLSTIIIMESSQLQLKNLQTPLLLTSSLMSILEVIICAFLLYHTIFTIYHVYLHPLRQLPGPKLWIAFPLLRYTEACLGNYDAKMRKFHEKYGEAVRYGPNEVSFITTAAWKDIYGHRHPQPRKYLSHNRRSAPDILNSDGLDHARFRKALSPGFSDKSLRDQEPLVKVYIDLLVERLKTFAVSSTPIDMVKWYNLTTFDIIGDLAFGEPFGGLAGSEYHIWVKNVFQVLRFIPFLRLMQQYPLLTNMVRPFIPRSWIERRKQQKEFARKITLKRLDRSELNGRGDFMDFMLKNRGQEGGINDDELISNAYVLILAGSETTATLLSGVTYWLLKTPKALAKVTNEVRSAFESEGDITFLRATARLPYMLACLDEALRIYPPVPSNSTRRSPPNLPIRVNGLEIPPGTIVSVHHSAAYWSELNFHQPRSYIPERWLHKSTADPSSPFYNDNRAVVQPFSVGPRNCIGKNLAYNEMRLILARILWNFDLELCQESENWAGQKIYMLWEKPELMCRLKRRGGV